MKKYLLFFLSIILLIGCGKDPIDPNNQHHEASNDLVGTNWHCKIWRSGTNSNYCVNCTIEFVSNTSANIVADFHRGGPDIADSRTYSCSYSASNGIISFSGASFVSNSISFNFSSASYSASSMKVSGTKDGSSTSWTFKK